MTSFQISREAGSRSSRAVIDAAVGAEADMAFPEMLPHQTAKLDSGQGWGWLGRAIGRSSRPGRITLSLRAQRGNPPRQAYLDGDCRVASLLAMTAGG